MTVATAKVLSPARQLELVAADVARAAAHYVREHLGQAAAAGTKSTPTDVVTHTDLESERRIRSELLLRCPGSSIEGEEFDDQYGDSGIGWIVDPIDGTVNFLYGLPVVSVSVAATLNGDVVAGAVVDVLQGEIFSATIGEGARSNGAKISCATPTNISQALVGTGFAYDADLRAREADLLTRVLPACRDIRCMGSAALNLCWVACGRLDGFFERHIKTYDYAAGALIAAEAGAVVELPDANDTDLTLAATPQVFDDLGLLVRGSNPR